MKIQNFQRREDPSDTRMELLIWANTRGRIVMAMGFRFGKMGQFTKDCGATIIEKAMGDKSIARETTTKGAGIKVWLGVVALICMWTVQNIRESLKRTCSMVEARKPGKTDLCIKVSSNMPISMGRVYSSGRMAPNTMGISKIMRLMGWVLSIGLMGECIKELGSMGKWMEEGALSGQMGENMLENIRMTSRTVLESSLGKY